MTSPAIAQHEFLAKVLDIPEYWAAITGGDASITVTEFYDGGADEPDLIASRGTHSNLVLRRSFKGGRDLPVQATLRRSIFKIYTKPIVLQPMRDGKADPAGKFAWTNCRLIRVGTPTFDANSETGVSWEIEFRPPKSAVIGASSTDYDG